MEDSPEECKKESSKFLLQKVAIPTDFLIGLQGLTTGGRGLYAQKNILKCVYTLANERSNIQMGIDISSGK